MKAKLSLFLVWVAIIQPQSANAFRVDTHVLIAEDVATELIKNKGQLIFIVPGKTISVQATPKALEAVTKSRHAFLLGSIGPDAFPGIYEGQMAIHPGSPQRWGSSDYLGFLFQQASSPEQFAFAYGVATHLAADVFAHTYVNGYAGGCWNLTDEDATVVEQRHFALEGFISRHKPLTPAINLAALLSQPQLSKSTVEYIVNSLLLNQVVAEKYAQDSPHISQIIHLRSELQELSAEGGPLRKIQDQIERAVWEKYVGLSITDTQLKQIRDLRQRWKTLETKGLKELHNGADELLKLCNSMHALHSELTAQKFQALATAAAVADEVRKTAESLEQEKRKLEDEKSSLERRILSEIPVPPHECGIRITLFGETACVDPVGHRIRDKAEAARRAALAAHAGLNHLKGEVTNAHRKLRDQLPAVSEQVKKLGAAVKEIDGLIETGIKTARDANALGKEITTRTNSDTLALISLIKGWAGDIDAAMNSYVLMNAQVISKASSNQGGDAIWNSVQTWIECDFPKIVGVGPLSSAKCKFAARIDEARAHLDKLEKYILDLALLGPLHTEVEKIRARVETAVRDEIRRFVLDKLAPELKAIIELLKGPIDESILRDTFTRSAGSVALLPIQDIASRARGDMGVGATGPFDRNTFAAYRNAVTLAKLALLDGNGLNKLAKELGIVAPTAFSDGDPLYPPPSDSRSDVRSPSTPHAPVLSGAILSIDGNHQWHSEPPPYPRTSQPHGPAVPSRLNGFRLWNDQQARDKIFRVLFIGPLAPGLDAPEELANALDQILPNDYLWRSCRAHPFPENYAESGCGP